MMKAAAGKSVTLLRGSDSAELEAWTGRQRFLVNARLDNAAEVAYGDRDYLVAVDDFEAVVSGFADATKVPKLGDRFVEEINGEDHTFEVMVPFSVDEPFWRYSEQNGRVTYRIHTQRVD